MEFEDVKHFVIINKAPKNTELGMSTVKNKEDKSTIKTPKNRSLGLKNEEKKKTEDGEKTKKRKKGGESTKKAPKDTLPDSNNEEKYENKDDESTNEAHMNTATRLNDEDKGKTEHKEDESANKAPTDTLPDSNNEEKGENDSTNDAHANTPTRLNDEDRGEDESTNEAHMNTAKLLNDEDKGENDSTNDANANTPTRLNDEDRGEDESTNKAEDKKDESTNRTSKNTMKSFNGDKKGEDESTNKAEDKKDESTNRTSKNTMKSFNGDKKGKGGSTNTARKNRTSGMKNRNKVSSSDNSTGQGNNKLFEKVPRTLPPIAKPPPQENTVPNEIISETEENNTEKSTQQQDYTCDKRNLMESKACFIVFGLKIMIMVAAVVLISSSGEISKAKSCDLEEALKLIRLNYTVHCKYDDIKEVSTKLQNLGISLLTVNFIFLLLILLFMLLSQRCKFVVCILFFFVAIFSVFMIMEYNDILNIKTAQKDTNYLQLQSTMAMWLEDHYTSDNVSSSDIISNNWNRFFIEYDCCAVNQVQGTTNDFDSTPWCTTSGSCQATASQIPKTCCNFVSEDDYENAPSDCHSSVNPGTFKSNCMDVIKQLSVVNVEECQLSLQQMSLIIMGTLELVASAFEIIAVITLICLGASNEKICKYIKK